MNRAQLLAFALVLVSSAAAAQPGVAPPAPSCSITIARAPDDVRAIVESWVQAEPRCTVKLELRIVPTAGGYYMLARDEFGRVRERVVPDAQSAGVLVASWMAADSHDGQTPYDVRKPELAPAPVAAGAIGGEVQLAPEGAPGMAPIVAATKPARREPRWLSIGGMFAMSGAGGGGVRSEWDWRQKGRMTFGLGASASRSLLAFYTPSSSSYMTTLDAFDSKLLAYGALSVRRGGWSLRSSLGLGLVYTSASLQFDYGTRAAGGVFPAGEVAMSVNLDLGSSWALSAGPVVSLYVQQYKITDAGPTYYYESTLSRDLDVMMYLAARYRL